MTLICTPLKGLTPLRPKRLGQKKIENSLGFQKPYTLEWGTRVSNRNTGRSYPIRQALVPLLLVTLKSDYAAVRQIQWLPKALGPKLIPIIYPFPAVGYVRFVPNPNETSLTKIAYTTP